jgi:hypothetical protein
VAEPQNVNSGLVATAGLVTIFVVIAIIVGTHGWYHYEMDEELAAKSQIVADPTIPDAISKAKANINAPKGPGQIPIDKAMDQFIQSHGSKGKTALVTESSAK